MTLPEIKPIETPEVLKLRTESEGLAELAESLDVNQGTMDDVSDVLGWLASNKKRLEAQRVLLVKPLNDHVKFINGMFREWVEPLESADKVVRGKVIDYQREQNRIAAEARAAEDERIRTEQARIAEAAEAHAAAEPDAPPLPPAPPPVAAPVPMAPRRTTRSRLGTTTVKKVWQYEITDPEAVPREYWFIDERKIAGVVRAGIRSIDPRTGKDVWAKPATKAAEVELLIARSDVVVFATEYEVFAVDAATGERRWSHGKYPRHLKDPAADWEDGGALRSHALYGDRLVSGRDTGELRCIALDTGRVVWSKTYRPIAAGPIRLVDPWVVYHAIQGGRIVLAVVDAAEGEWLGSIATQQERALEDLFVTLDGQIVLVTSQTISSYDTSTLSLRWNVPLSGTVRQPSLLIDLEAIYFSDNGSEIEKLHLEDGRRLWRSQRLVSRSGDELLVGRQDNSLIVSTSSSVTAVDADTGLTLWRGTAPDRPRFVGRFLTKAYVVAIDANGEMHDGQSVAYFYDHRNASGLIPRVGGALKLGQFEHIQAVLVVDGALLLQSGSTIHVYTNEQSSP